VVVSATKITCTFNLTGATTGAWNVVVTEPTNSQQNGLGGGFTVTGTGVTTITITNWRELY
ncbi:hypothetical protein L6304_03000, partial [bacterium]|nr:hypothetical protein [bacterium]